MVAMTIARMTSVYSLRPRMAGFRRVARGPMVPVPLGKRGTARSNPRGARCYRCSHAYLGSGTLAYPLPEDRTIGARDNALLTSRPINRRDTASTTARPGEYEWTVW